MRPVLSFLLLACACAAQDAKPPADVDQALRARVDEFFKAHVSAHFRKAEELVAEESKDFFYNQNKPHYMAYGGVQRITYSEQFTRAYVIVTVASASAAEFGDVPAIPIPTTWKLEDGKWCWYFDKAMLKMSPFGDIPQATVDAALKAMEDPDAKPKAVPPGFAEAMKTSIPDPGAALLRDANIAAGQVKLDQPKLEMKPGGRETVTVKNTGADNLSLLLVGQVEGIDAAIDRRELPAGESATITLKASAKAKSGGLNVVVIQTGEMIPLAVSVK